MPRLCVDNGFVSALTFAVLGFAISGCGESAGLNGAPDQSFDLDDQRANNIPPIAMSGTAATEEDQNVDITLLGGDADSNLIAFEVIREPANGTLSGQAPDLTYLPDPDFHGSDSFTFIVVDAHAESVPALVSITVDPVNDAPRPQGIPNASTSEDVALDLELYAADPEGDALEWAMDVVLPSHGTLEGELPNVTYVPDPNYFGNDAFTYRVYDGRSWSAPARVDVAVTSVNDPPTESETLQLEVTEDGLLTFEVDDYVVDVDGDDLVAVITRSPSAGQLQQDGMAFTYTPFENYDGADSFGVTASDGKADVLFEWTVDVAAEADAPVPSDLLVVNMPEDRAMSINLGAMAWDPDGDELDVIVDLAPEGELVENLPWVEYTPPADFAGLQYLAFRISDGEHEVPLVLTIVVDPENDRPRSIANEAVAMDEDELVAINLYDWVADPEGDALTLTMVTPPENGVLNGASGDLTYSPDADFFGPDQFEFRADDGEAAPIDVLVSLIVNPVNDDPEVPGSMYFEVDEDDSVAIALVGSDPEDGVLAWTVGAPGFGILSGAAPDLMYAPAENRTGVDSFAYEARDTEGAVVEGVAYVQILPMDDPPIAHGESVSLVTGQTIEILPVYSDPDGDPAGITTTIRTEPAMGYATVFGSSILYTAPDDFEGFDTVGWVGRDSTGLESEEVTADIRVLPRSQVLSGCAIADFSTWGGDACGADYTDHACIDASSLICGAIEDDTCDAVGQGAAVFEGAFIGDRVDLPALANSVTMHFVSDGVAACTGYILDNSGALLAEETAIGCAGGVESITVTATEAGGIASFGVSSDGGRCHILSVDIGYACDGGPCEEASDNPILQTAGNTTLEINTGSYFGAGYSYADSSSELGGTVIDDLTGTIYYRPPRGITGQTDTIHITGYSGMQMIPRDVSIDIEIGDLVWYVNSDNWGASTPNGTSWRPYRLIEAAANAAQPGSHIYVGGSIYNLPAGGVTIAADVNVGGGGADFYVDGEQLIGFAGYKPVLNVRDTGLVLEGGNQVAGIAFAGGWTADSTTAIWSSYPLGAVDIEKVEFSDLDFGIQVEQSADFVRIEDVNMLDIGEKGVVLDGVSSAFLSNISLTRVDDTGLYLHDLFDVTVEYVALNEVSGAGIALECDDVGTSTTTINAITAMTVASDHGAVIDATYSTCAQASVNVSYVNSWGGTMGLRFTSDDDLSAILLENTVEDTSGPALSVDVVGGDFTVTGGVYSGLSNAVPNAASFLVDSGELALTMSQLDLDGADVGLLAWATGLGVVTMELDRVEIGMHNGNANTGVQLLSDGSAVLNATAISSTFGTPGAASFGFVAQASDSSTTRLYLSGNESANGYDLKQLDSSLFELVSLTPDTISANSDGSALQGLLNKSNGGVPAVTALGTFHHISNGDMPKP